MPTQATNDNDRGKAAPEPHALGVGWQALVEDSGVAVLLLSPEGSILFSSEAAASHFGLPGGASGTLAGRRLHEILTPEIATERLAFVRRVADQNAPLVIEHTQLGRRYRSTLRPFPADAAGNQRVLMVTRPIAGAAAPSQGVEVVKARHNDFGPLSSLTPREMEILCLIGQGMATADIAKHLHRSEKTVEWHRVSLGNKLGVTNRVELARIAIRSGLVENEGGKSSAE